VLGLGPLGVGVRARHDAGAGEQAGAPAVQGGAAQGDRPLAVAGGVHPADRAGVAAAVERLQGGDRGHGGVPRAAGHRRRRVQQAGQLQRGRQRLGQLGGHLGGQVGHGGQPHHLRGGDPDAVGDLGQALGDGVDDQPVLDRLLVRAGEARQPAGLVVGGRAARHRAGHRPRGGDPAAPADQQLGAGAHQAAVGVHERRRAGARPQPA
jgi:hypothetical protein